MPETWARTEFVDDETVVVSRVRVDNRDRFTIARATVVRLLREAGYQPVGELDATAPEELPHIGTS